MSRLTQYLYLQSLMLVVLVTLGFTCALWLVKSITLIQLAVDRGTGLTIFLELIVLTLPQLIQEILPLACFIGVLFTYNRLISDSEIIVMRACGSSQWDLLRPALIIAATGAAIMLSISLYFLPASQNTFKDLQATIRNQFAASLLQEGSFTPISNRLTVYVRSRSADRLEGLLIEDRRDATKPVTWTAEKGLIAEVDGHTKVIMVNATRSTWDNQKNQHSMLELDQYALDLDAFKDADDVRTKEPNERYINELFFQGDNASDSRFSSLLRVEGHNRLVVPLSCFSFVALSVACLLTGELNRRGQTMRMMVAIGMAVIVQVLQLTSVSSARRGTIGVAPMYLSVIVPSLIGFGVVLYGLKFWRRQASEIETTTVA